MPVTRASVTKTPVTNAAFLVACGRGVARTLERGLMRVVCKADETG